MALNVIDYLKARLGEKSRETRKKTRGTFQNTSTSEAFTFRLNEANNFEE